MTYFSSWNNLPGRIFYVK